MARIDSFLKKWASVPSQFERPADALIDRGWAGGAAEDPPEAKWENWWHNRVDEALAELESKGALQWFADVPYSVAATSHDDGQNWIAVLPSEGIKPGSAEDVGHWARIGANATETLRGVIRIATQSEVDDGALDDVAVTPKKLRWGFSASWGVNNYIVFPTWLGGLVIQFGSFTVTALIQAVTFPIGFPTACRGVFLSQDANSNTAAYESLMPSGISATGFTIYTNQGSGTAWWFAIGK